MTFPRLVAASFLVAVMRHPWRFIALIAVVAFLGWLSGYDVR